MFLKKQMFALTIAAHIETEILVREWREDFSGRMKEKVKTQKKRERKNWKNQHYLYSKYSGFFPGREKKKGEKALL